MRPVNAEVMSTASQTRLARIVAAGVVALALLQGGTAAAQEATIDFTVSGSSTIRGWTCTVPGTAEVTTGSSTAVRGLADGVQAATLSLRVKDFVCPQEEMREHLLEAMKADAVILNGARGQVLDLDALAAVLNEGHLGGAALDVFPQEPFEADHPIRACEQVVFTPHAADQTPEGVELLNQGAVENIIAFLEGSPNNNVATR